MWILEFSDYKVFLRALIKTYPQEGRGQGRKLAKHLNIPPMTLSLVLARDRHFTTDQALGVASYFKLEERESEYFLNLVNLARAETKEAKKYFERKLSAIREESQNIKNLVASREEVTDIEKGIYYSNWYYAGVWLLVSIEGYQTVDRIAEHFGISRAKVNDILAFLVGAGLCTQKGSQFRNVNKSTHVDSESAFVNNHRKNWRDKAREKFTEPGEKDKFYSSPVSISEKDAEKFHKELLNLIKNFSKQVEGSRGEKIMCLNIDWFEC
jgi:uncharacterized protein (TIGR02147 family)